MFSSKWMVLIGVLLILSSFVLADTAPCAQDSFRQACASCTFDANGKMNQQCWKSYQQSGTACIAKEYPVTAGMYSQGNCPEIDQCAGKLTACVSKASTGNDKTDCSTTAVRDCYWSADQCVKDAEFKCNPLGVHTCPLTFVLFGLVAVGVVYSNISDD